MESEGEEGGGATTPPVSRAGEEVIEDADPEVDSKILESEKEGGLIPSTGEGVGLVSTWYSYQ